MKIVCSQAELLKGVQSVQSIISNRVSLPVLANILLETQKDKLKLAATDLEVGIKTEIATEILKEGSITLPAKMLFDIVRELPNQDVQLEVTPEYKVILTCGKIVFKIMGLPKDEFPIIPDFKEENSFEIPMGTLKNMIQKTIFAISNDETRYVLTGVLLQTSNNNLEMIATDGRRLAYINGGKLSKGTKNKLDVIIPSKALREINRLINDEDDKKIIKIELTENQISYKVGATTLVSRLIEGKFPNYKQVIPKEHSLDLVLDTAKFLSAIKRMSLVAPEKAESIKLELANNKAVISGMAQGLGEAQEEIEIEYKGNKFEVAYNPKYLIEVLKNISTPNIILELSNPMSPGVIKPQSDEEYLYVIMPMRL
ncbi:MAG: DNA polymerase III subunit beta [bacterium]|nr:DNA polymerase III subunit beta [bacterium]MDD5755975.1 DNA polymerase III subunit beta [bacterium]